MDLLVQLLLNGIVMGLIYALVAIEYTLIYNATGLINLCHDKFIMFGAYFFGGTFARIMPFGWAIVLTMICMALFGVVVSTLVFNPLRNMGTLYALFGTLMLGRIIAELTRIIWGPIPFTVGGFLRHSIKIGSVTLSVSYLYIIAISVSIVIALQIMFRHTKLGKSMRCVTQNKEAAALMGINVSANIRLTIILSALICSVIGILIIPLFNVSSTMANMIGLKGFASGVIGGFGNYAGAIIGGLFLGILEQIGVQILPAVYKDVISFVAMILFLLFRPGGVLYAKKS